MAFTPKQIAKELDFANLAKHNDNYNAIKTELDAHDTHVAAQSAHGSTSAATAGKIVQRDSAGRAKVAAPAAADDIARKAEVDTVQADLDAHEADAAVHLSAADRTKLDGIEDGAEPNQNAFAQVNNVAAAAESDTLTIAGGTGITVTTNPTTKTVTVTATGDATPGAHGSSHNNDGADPIPDLVALRGEFDSLTAADIGAETPAGAQAKVDTLAGEGNTQTVAGVAAQLAETVRGYVNPTEYGADPTGSADSTEAIQAAIDSGKPVYIPPGVFNFTSLILLSGTRIMGSGIHTSRLRCTDNGALAIVIKDASKFQLSDFTLIGPGGSASDTGNDGICISSDQESEANYSAKEWIMSNVRVQDFGGTGVRVEKCIAPGNAWGRTGQLTNLQVTNCYRGFMFGTRGEYTESVNLMAWACIWGVEVAAGNTKISNSQFDNNANGARLTGGANNGHGQFVGCSFNHNNNYTVLVDGVTYGHVFDGCNFFVGDLRVRNSAGVNFVGGILAPSTLNLENNTGSIMFESMQVRSDQLATIGLTGTNIYKFTNCVERSTGLSMLNNYDCTAIVMSRLANATYTASPIKVAMTQRNLEVYRGYDYTFRYTSNQYTAPEKGLYDITFSADYAISSGSGTQTAQIVKNGSVIASSYMTPKTGGASGVVKALVLLDAGDIIYPQITDTGMGTGTRQIVASPETYFNAVVISRVPAV